MTRAYSYLRFSTPQQQQGNSFERQTALAASFAASHGLELDDKLTFQDLGVSAYRGRNEADGRLGDFLRAVDHGDVEPGSYLLVENLDRISRQAALDALGTLQRIVERGVTLVTLSDQRAYTRENLRQDSVALLTAVLFFARANEESAIKGARVRAAWDAKRRAAADRPVTRTCPAWLRPKEDRTGFEVIPERGEVVRRIFEMAANGMGQHAIADALNADEVPTFGDPGRRAPARHWHRSYIIKILASPAPLGAFVPHGSTHEGGKRVRIPWEPVEGYFPAVVDPETARRARLVTGPRANPKRGRHAAQPVRNVLANLARCPLCGGSMTRVSKGSRAKAGKPYLVCTMAKIGAGCSYRAVRLELVERALRDRADELVFKDAEEVEDPQLAALQTELEKLQQLRNNFADAVGQSGGSPVLYERLAEAEKRYQEVRQEIADHVGHIEDTREPLVVRRMTDLREALRADPFDVERANIALRVCAAAVEVDYRTGQLHVAWKHGGETAITFAFPEGDAEAC